MFEIAVPYHNYTQTLAEAAVASLTAGVDSNCGGVFASSLGGAPAAAIDTAVQRVLELRIKLGLLDEGVGWSQIGLEAVDSQAHRDLALRAARESITLLKNTNGTLPLPGNIKHLAMVGPFANASKNQLGGYHGTPPFVISPLAAMRKLLPPQVKLTHAMGCTVLNCTAESLAAATAAVAGADAVVLGRGLCGNNYPQDADPGCAPQLLSNNSEHEGTDRASLKLTAAQAQLAAHVAAAAQGSPLVLFLQNAAPIDLGATENAMSAIVWAGQGGQSGGQALAEVLLGHYNPGGSLPYTVYPQSFADAVRYDVMSMRAPPGRTYKFYDGSAGKPLYEFGWGLSFTSWAIEWATPPPTVLSSDKAVSFGVKVRNIGKRTGGKVILGFVRFSNTTAVRPPTKQLFAFARVENVTAGASTIVSLALTDRDVSVVDASGERLVPQGTVECVVSTGEAPISPAGCAASSGRGAALCRRCVGIRC